MLLFNLETLSFSRKEYAKLSTVAGFTFGAGILFVPVSYVIGDVLTEVYGYANARRCIWAGFAAMIFMAFMVD